jgi:hypothetical protein
MLQVSNYEGGQALKHNVLALLNNPFSINGFHAARRALRALCLRIATGCASPYPSRRAIHSFTLEIL